MYLNLNALELDKKDTVKQPSASVKPDSQLSVKLGKISEGISLFYES